VKPIYFHETTITELMRSNLQQQHCVILFTKLTPQLTPSNMQQTPSD